MCIVEAIQMMGVPMAHRPLETILPFFSFLSLFPLFGLFFFYPYFSFYFFSFLCMGLHYGCVCVCVCVQDIKPAYVE